jgi:hypothetical protein
LYILKSKKETVKKVNIMDTIRIKCNVAKFSYGNGGGTKVTLMPVTGNEENKHLEQCTY